MAARGYMVVMQDVRGRHAPDGTGAGNFGGVRRHRLGREARVVHPDGFAMSLTYGIVRARYRDGFDDPSPIEPHRPYEDRIEP